MDALVDSIELLACVTAIAQDVARGAGALGADVAIEINTYDECRVIPIKRIARRIKSADAGLVCTNRSAVKPVPGPWTLPASSCAAACRLRSGEFHVSGCLAMLPALPPDLVEAQQTGVSLFAGEAEGRLVEVFADALVGALKSLYNYMDDTRFTASGALFLPIDIVRRYGDRQGAFDAEARFCPFQCSFCTIVNVQGRKSRWRDAGDVERLVRVSLAQGVYRFFITDDNFARNRNWEAIFDRLIEMRERDGIDVHLVIQVDTLCYRIPRFIEKAAQAGVKRVFIGLENINPDNLLQAKKKQNRVQGTARCSSSGAHAG